MKWFHRILGLLLGILILAVLFRVLMPAFEGGDGWRAFLDFVFRARLETITLCLVLIIGLFMYMLTGLPADPRGRYLTYETANGNISVSIKALQEFIAHIKGDFASVLQLNPKVSTHDESLSVVLEVKVRAGTHIHELSRLLQDRTRNLIQEKIGISEVRDIEVRVVQIAREKESKPAEITPRAPPAGETP